MLYTDTLNTLSEELKPMLSEVFELAYQRQAHPGDLLLLIAHAHNDSGGQMTGPGHVGHSMNSQMKFIQDYRKTYFPNRETYYEALERTPLTTPPEDFTTHIEVLIYLKVWEMTMFQNQLYQLSLLMNGQGYDWDGVHGRTSENFKEAFAKIKAHCPTLITWLDGVYDNKIRNAVGHSDFYLLAREAIEFLKDNEPYVYMPLDEWNIILSKTLLFQNGIAEQLRIYSDRYRAEASAGDKYIIVRAPDKVMRDIPLSFDQPIGWLDYRNMIASGRTPA